MHKHTTILTIVFFVVCTNHIYASSELEKDDDDVILQSQIFGDDGIPKLLKLKLLTRNTALKKLLIIHVLRKPGKDDCDKNNEDCNNYYGGTRNIFGNFVTVFVISACLLAQASWINKS